MEILNLLTATSDTLLNSDSTLNLLSLEGIILTPLLNNVSSTFIIKLFKLL